MGEKTEAQELLDLLGTGWRDDWTVLSDVGREIDGWETVDRSEGEDRRWTRSVLVITRAPSGRHYAWNYEHALTENSESSFDGGLPQEVQEEVTIVTKHVTSWVGV